MTEQNSQVCRRDRHWEVQLIECELCSVTFAVFILGDPGADSGGKGKTKRAEKNGAKKRREDSARLVFPLPPLSAPGSPRMLLF